MIFFFFFNFMQTWLKCVKIKCLLDQVKSLLQQSQNKEGLELHSLLSEIHVQVEAHKHTNDFPSTLSRSWEPYQVSSFMSVCVTVFASGPRQHSRERNGARAAANPRRDTNPVGRRDCQDHSDREGQRHTTGERTSLKTGVKRAPF